MNHLTMSRDCHVTSLFVSLSVSVSLRETPTPREFPWIPGSLTAHTPSTVTHRENLPPRAHARRFRVPDVTSRNKTMIDPVTHAERELDTRLVAHIPDDRWRAQLAARFIADLLGEGWRPPQRPPDELAAKRDARPPNAEWRRARAELAARTREEQNQ